MLKLIVMQVIGQITALFTTACTLIKGLLLNLVKRLHASSILVFQSAASQLNPLVQTVLKIKAWRANPTTVEQSINQEPISAKQIATQLGLQPQTIARKTRQRAKPASKKGK